jgi:hypothetical protein
MFEKGKIQYDGTLFIWRKSRYLSAWCINHQPNLCNARCSHFGEPEVHEYGTHTIPITLSKYTAISLCKKTVKFKEFIDERK